jgi:pimeloyl-ACP methyl ester carboxylesterase
MNVATSQVCDLYYEETGAGPPILLIHPSGATAGTWGSLIDELAPVGSVITYDRRGYARSGWAPVRSVSTHTADAAALLEYLGVRAAVVVGTSAGGTIAIDLAVRRPDLVHAVVAHEAPWQMTHHLPSASQVGVFAKIGWRSFLRRPGDAVEALLWAAYEYRDGGSAWDAFPEKWRRVARENARATLADFRNSIGGYPSAAELATISVPVVCSYGARSPAFMPRLVRLIADAVPTARVEQIENSAHAAPFDAPRSFARLIADSLD